MGTQLSNASWQGDGESESRVVNFHLQAALGKGESYLVYVSNMLSWKIADI